MSVSPFSPPPYANFDTVTAYEKLEAMCSGLGSSAGQALKSEDVIALIRPTYFDLMDFVGVRTQQDLCAKIVSIHWWQENGPAVYWSAGLLASAAILFFGLRLAWRRKDAALSATGDAVVSGLAVGVRAKRKASKRIDDLKQRVRDRADRPDLPT